MKIAYITTGNIYTNSSANIRNVALIKGLEELGNDVHVFCFSNNKTCDKGFVNNLNDSNVFFVGAFIGTPSSQKENKHISFFKQVWMSLRKQILLFYRHFQIYDPYKHKISDIDKSVLNWDNYDVCISSSDPKSSHLFVYNAKKKGYKFKWIQYWGDPMTLDLTNQSWVMPLLNKEENRLFFAADFIVLTNKATRDFLEKKYPQYSSKFFSIPTSIFDKNNVKASRKRISDQIVIGYYGGCRSLMRNILPLKETVEHNKKRYNLIVAGGNDVGLMNSEWLTVFDRVSSQELFQLINKTDILVVLENRPQKANEPCKQIPGKMYHYALLGKPILVICETGSLQKEFGIYDVFYFCQNNSEDIKRSIELIASDILTKEFKPVNDFLPKNVAKELMKHL